MLSRLVGGICDTTTTMSILAPRGTYFTILPGLLGVVWDAASTSRQTIDDIFFAHDSCELEIRLFGNSEINQLAHTIFPESTDDNRRRHSPTTTSVIVVIFLFHEGQTLKRVMRAGCNNVDKNGHCTYCSLHLQEFPRVAYL
eukprot:scaffold24878_cov147-Cylindrotheca_fusiformis.AAC.1